MYCSKVGAALRLPPVRAERRRRCSHARGETLALLLVGLQYSCGRIPWKWINCEGDLPGKSVIEERPTVTGSGGRHNALVDGWRCVVDADPTLPVGFRLSLPLGAPKTMQRIRPSEALS